jgi:hypothetical protein
MRRRESGFLIALLAGAFWSTSLATAQGRSRPPAPAVAEKRSPAKAAELPSATTLAKTRPPSWVLEKPARSTQTQKSSRERGTNPCWVRDPGFGAYRKWDRAPSMGQMIVPQDLAIGPRGEFDLVVHFHGHESARKEWVQAVESGVLVGIDLGNGSGPYARGLARPGRFQELVRSVERAVAERAGLKRAKVRHLGVSAWSAGYGAVESILRTSYGREHVDSVILLDSLHSGYEDGTLNREQLKPFADFARRAARGEKFMFVSHSSIIPPTYASTTETAQYLIWQVGGTPGPAKPRPGDPMGLELLSRYSRGQFHVRGYAGNDKLDHCAHIALLGDVLRVRLAPRWGMRQVATDLRVATR